MVGKLSTKGYYDSCPLHLSHTEGLLGPITRQTVLDPRVFTRGHNHLISFIENDKERKREKDGERGKMKKKKPRAAESNCGGLDDGAHT